MTAQVFPEILSRLLIFSASVLLVLFESLVTPRFRSARSLLFTYWHCFSTGGQPKPRFILPHISCCSDDPWECVESTDHPHEPLSRDKAGLHSLPTDTILWYAPRTGAMSDVLPSGSPGVGVFLMCLVWGFNGHHPIPMKNPELTIQTHPKINGSCFTFIFFEVGVVLVKEVPCPSDRQLPGCA